MQRPKLLVRTGEKRLSISSVWSVMALWVEDLDAALQIKFNGMSRRLSDSIKSSPKRLCLESATYTFLDAVLSSVLIIDGNSPVIWIQSPKVLHATCLVDVGGGWPMVFLSLCEIRFMSEAVSICKRTGWLFSFTDTYFRFDFELGRNVATRLFVCVFLFSLCLLCGRFFVVLCTGGVQIPSLCPC